MPRRSLVWRNAGVRTAALMGLLLWNGPLAAQEIDAGHVVTFEENLREFELPAKVCLEYCIEITYDETRFECAPQLAPPVDGCDLPWMDPSGPTPDPFGQGLQCIPPEPELVGYGLHESNARVTERVHHRANCTSTRQVRRQRRPRTNNPPARDCPDQNGPWVDTQRSVPTFRFVPCGSR